MDNWKTVFFTNEWKVKFFRLDRSVRVRRRGDHITEPCMHRADRFWGPSLMIWDGMSSLGRTELVILNGGTITAASYVEHVIRPHLMPYSQRVGNNFVFMHDIACAFTARATQRAVPDANISELPWPAMGPILTRLHLCDQLKRSLKETHSHVNIQPFLINALKLC